MATRVLSLGTATVPDDHHEASYLELNIAPRSSKLKRIFGTYYNESYFETPVEELVSWTAT